MIFANISGDPYEYPMAWTSPCCGTTPASLEPSSASRWIQYMDIYTLPHTIVFDSWSHLHEILNTITDEELLRISQKMVFFMEKLKERKKKEIQIWLQTAFANYDAFLAHRSSS